MKGRHPDKNCMMTMDNPNKSTLLKPPAFGYEVSEDGEIFLCRYRKPRWRLRLESTDPVDERKLADSLCKAASWLTKRQR